MPDARSLREGDAGTVFVSSRSAGKVYAIVEKDGKRQTKTMPTSSKCRTASRFTRGALYVATMTSILRFDDIEKRLDPPKPVTVYDQLPDNRAHGWRYIAIGPDRKLYVGVGAPCNICLPPPGFAQIRRMNLDGSGVEVVTGGAQHGRLRFRSEGRQPLVHRQRPRLDG